MNKDEAKQKIQQLVEKYEKVKKLGQIKKYSEEDTKKDFILPLFDALGWNTADRNEVSSEEHIKSAGLVDYGFYINNRAKFYLEAKPLEANLHKEDFAEQAIKYSWNRGITWAGLTDFESIKIFNAEAVSKYLGDKLVFEIPYDEYLSRFDQLWQLSKDAFETDSLDTYAEQIGKKLQKVPVSELLYKDLNECRNILLNTLKQWNSDKNISNELLEEGVQRLLDRLIFIRVLEDRGIEESTLHPLIRAWETSKKKTEVSIYESMVHKFREMDDIYNSNLFQKHPFENWEEHSDATKKVVEILYGKKGYYEYDFRAMPADVLGNVYENYLGRILSQSKKGIEITQDPKKRKEQGIYYTPSFIVDYIVENALKPVLDKCKSIADLKKIKVLDPACGSGSFLIKALEVINEKYKEFGARGDEYTRLTILTENIYGVDLDDQAVEIARLNLLINALDSKMKLPSLSDNIKNGNSLISGPDEELEKYFGDNFKEKRPFNWKEEFPEVFAQGGFDVVIGNPPYGADLEKGDKKFFYYNSSLSEYQLDTYILFIEKSIHILKSGGIFGMILPNTWLTNIKVNKLREYLVGSTNLLNVANFSQKIFAGATVDNVVLIFENQKPEQDNKVQIDLISLGHKETHYLSQRDWISEKVFNIHISGNEKRIISKIEDNTIPLGKACKITVGIKPYQVGKGSPPQKREDVSSRIFDADEQKDETYRLFLRGRDINRYVINPNERQWISYGKWLAEPRKIELFDDKGKIVIRQTGDSLIAALDNNKFLCLNNMHTINLQSSDFNIKYILGLLNSSLLNYYFQYLNPEKGEALAEVKATNVKRLPIKRMSLNNQTEIVNLVSVMIDLNKLLQKSVENSNEWEKIKSQIEGTDKKIDEEVYKLYGLTSEEVKVVEGNND